MISRSLICILAALIFLLHSISCMPAGNLNYRTDAAAKPEIDFSRELKPGDVEGSISVNGSKRTFILHLPPGFSNKTDLPLVIVLHGGGGNAENAEAMTGMSKKADSEGFIAVYPNGSGRLSNERLLTWNSGNCCGYALDNNVDDIGFIRRLIENLDAVLPIDPDRVYATGISNGGMMSYLLACTLSDKIAAIAPVAGAMGMTLCSPSHPVSVIIFHGTADEHVLYEGGTPLKQADTHKRTDKPVSYSVDFWIQADGCSKTAEKGGSGNIKIDSYRGGKNGTEVALYTIVGGRHAWPGGNPGWAGGDEPSTEISATDIMWDFFKSHPKTQ